MSRSDEARLLFLATSVSDGRSVDWRREGVSAGPMQERIQRLRILECIAKVCGMPQDESLVPVTREQSL